MLRRAKSYFVRPGDDLAHVDVNVLAALRNYGVEPPHDGIAAKQERQGAIGPRLIDYAVEQPFKGIAPWGD